MCVVAVSLLLTACAPPGSDLASNVYQADQVNQQQQAKVVNILAVLPAKVEVSNAQAQQSAEVVGGLLGAVGGAVIGNNIASHAEGNTLGGGALGGVGGALAGSLVPASTLVDGVSLTYVEDGQTLNSAQVGAMCQFAPGKAIVISTTANETRVQPNATCPVTKTAQE
jgi:outer membrane lipoprotein SlyB